MDAKQVGRGKTSTQSLEAPFHSLSPSPAQPFGNGVFAKRGLQTTKEMGELKQRDTPHLWRLLPRQVIFNRKGNPRADRAPLFSRLPQALASHLPPKAPEPGTGNPSPTPCFPGAESPKFSPLSSSPEGAGRGRVGERSPQASCWVGSPALGAAGVPGAAGPARPSRRFALTACLPARRPPSLPLPAAGPTRHGRPPSTYPEGV